MIKINTFVILKKAVVKTTTHILSYQDIPWKVAPQQSFPPLNLIEQNK